MAAAELDAGVAGSLDDRWVGLDAESRTWLETLTGSGPSQTEAVARLHALLLRAARHEIGRRRSALPRGSAGELDDLALQVADDACMSVLARLDDFRGLSRFTTWAYKFALLDAAVKVRRLTWRNRDVHLPPEGWDVLVDTTERPDSVAEHAELVAALKAGIRDLLTPRQRDVLLTVVVAQVPIDVLADHMGTTRGALYKTVHDARRRLRQHLEQAGLLRRQEAVS